MMIRLTSDGSLAVLHELPRLDLPAGDPSAVADPFTSPLDARSLAPKPEPIYDAVNYPERED